MRVVVITPPDPVITLEQAKAHLGVDHDDDDTLIADYVEAATGHIDGPDGWLGRALGRQTLEARFDTFETAGDDLRLPCKPIVSLVSIGWAGADRLPRVGDLGDVDLIDDCVIPEGMAPWSGMRNGREVLKIRYVAGYEKLPGPIRSALLLMIGDLYRFRETSSDQGVTPTAIPMSTTVTNLLNPLRLYG
jgi:uncharacterized phiE125 gp8 family phage protein